MRRTSLTASVLLVGLAFSSSVLATSETSETSMHAPEADGRALAQAADPFGDPPPPPPPPEVSEDGRLHESLEDAFEDPAPPPPDAVVPPAAAVDPSPALEEDDEPVEDEEPARPKRKRRRSSDEEGAGGLDPLLTGAAQVGVGAVTGLVCCAGATGLTCVTTALTAPLAAIPFLGTLISGIVTLGACTSTGAAVGGVEAVVGNLIGSEEASILWPAAAGAGVGAAYGAVALVLGLAQAALTNSTGTLLPNETLAVTGPIGFALSLLTLGLCAATCVAIPVVPAVVYAMTAEPKVPDADGGYARGEMDPPASAQVASSIAY